MLWLMCRSGQHSDCMCVIVATLLLKTDVSQAAVVYRQLLERNPENSLYFYGLEQALQPCEYHTAAWLWLIRDF